MTTKVKTAPPLSSPKKSCPNCDTDHTGQFCPCCGQKVIARRTTLSSLGEDFLQVVLNLEFTLLRTAKQLTLHPKIFLEDYLAGRRKRYTPPLQYFLLPLTVYLLLREGLHDYAATTLARPVPAPGDAHWEHFQFMQVLISNSYYLEFLFPPILALFYSLMLRKEGVNYAESLIFSIYLDGHVLLLSCVLLPLNLVAPFMHKSKEMVGLLFFLYATMSTSSRSWHRALGAGLLVYCLSRLAFHGLQDIVIKLVLQWQGQPG